MLHRGKRAIAAALVGLLMMVVGGAVAAQDDTANVGRPVRFEENLGQWDTRVRYQAQLQDAAIFLEDDGITVALRSPIAHPAPYDPKPPAQHAYKMHFVGAQAVPVGADRQEGYSNYFIGNNPARWRSHVGGYASVHYRGLYPDIDLEVYTASGAMKYNFIVHPEGDPSLVRMLYEGTDGVSVGKKGELRVKTSVKEITEAKPYVFQTDANGHEQKVEGRWKVKATAEGYEISVEIGNYDPRRDLVIDPTLFFSTYTGSYADNWGTTATYDSEKNTYTAGLVFDLGYPVSVGAYDTYYNGATDIGIFKVDSIGSHRLFATYLGGSAADMPHSMFVNNMGELVIFGTTGSGDFPTTEGAYQRTHGGGELIDYESAIIRFPNGSDIFVCRFNSTGSVLQASTLVGGSGNDGLNYKQHYNNSYVVVMAGNDSLYYNYGDGARGELITDNLGNVYVGSTTTSTDFPTTEGTVQRRLSAGQDGVIFKLDYNLRNMLWASYLGGSDDDAIYSIDVDSSYNVVLCGGTSSTDFPTTDGGFQTTYGGGTADGFVSKISHDGTRLIASSYIGSDAYDQMYFARVGNSNEVFLFGQTAATGGTMIYNAGYSVYGSGMYLARMLPDLSARRWSTVFGTPGRINLSPTAFTADICNRVYAAGWGRDFVGYNGVRWYTAGTSGMETTADAYSDTTDGQDFYIISVDASGNRLEYATFFGELHQGGLYSYGGGDHVDGGTSRFDRLANLYQSVCGSCGGTQKFPTTASAWSRVNRSTNCNNAVFRFNVTDNFPVAEFVPPQTGCAPYTVAMTNTGRGEAFHWDFGDGTTSSLRSPNHTYTTPGDYLIRLIASLPGGCTDADTMDYTLRVLSSNPVSHILLKSCSSASIQIGPAPSLGASYRWIEGTVSDPTISNPWINQDGRYVLQTTTNVCSQTDTFNVQRYNLIGSLTTRPVSCHDTADGKVSILLGARIIPDSVSYTISPDAPSQTSGNTIEFHQLAPETRYHITLTGYGCSDERDVLLENPTPVAYNKEVSPALCADSCVGWLRIIHAPEVDTVISALCEGQHITQLEVGGCPLIDTTVIIRSHSLDSLHAWADAYQIYLGENVRLHASIAPEDNAGVTYIWQPVYEIDRPTSPDPIAHPTDTLVCYTVTATIGNCSAKDSVHIRCKEIACGPPKYVVPNAFTPNADGVNDAICFPNEGILEFSINIFNRWGECVYQSTDPSACWDGTYRNTPCLPGVYTYTCHLRCIGEETNDFKGDITLLR